MIRGLSGVAAWACCIPAAAWLAWRSGRLGRFARPITETERAALAPWFGGLLGRARVVEADRVPPPLPRPLARVLLRGPLRRLNLAWASGMAFPGIVLVSPGEPAAPGAPGTVATSLLFHELVHIAQYEALGTRRFAREYIRGWLRAGCRYRDIPLEAEAYDLTARFESGECFDVTAHVRSSAPGRTHRAG